MFAFIALLPAWVKVLIVAGLLFGASELRHWWIDRGLHKEIASLSQTVQEKENTINLLNLGLKEQELSIEKLKATVQKQNSDLELLVAKKREAESKAADAVRKLLAKKKKAADRLRDPNTDVTPGWKGMNEWLRERFSQQ